MLLFVDVKNLLYKSLHAVGDGGNHRHLVTATMRQLAAITERYRSAAVYAFWDAPRADVWRRRILPTYKDRPSADPSAAAKLTGAADVLAELFAALGVRQFRRKDMEADDLIYAAAKTVQPTPVVIVSSDSDLQQVAFHYDHVKVYHHGKRQELPRCAADPALLKALIGDGTDNVPGYDGIGPKRAPPLLDPVLLRSFLQERGRDVLLRNLLLIDLSACPDLLVNRLYVLRILGDDSVRYDRDAARAVLMRHRVADALSEFEALTAAYRPKGT